MPDTEAPEDRLAPRMLVAAAIAAIGGLLYGYDTGIISGALLQISDEFKMSSATEQLVTASILAGAVIGALVASRLSDRLGRHTTILIIAVVFVIGSLGSASAPSPVLLATGRLVLGFAVGAATQTVPMYVAELAPAARRGRLVLMFQTAIGVGIVIATIVGATEAVSWRISIGAACVPAAIMFLAMLRLPESPRWFVSRGRHDDARAALAKVRDDDADLDAELKEIERADREEQEADTKGWPGLKEAWVRPALIVGCGIAIFTQLSGIELIIYYAPTILTDNGFSDSAALRVSVALGVTYLLMMLIGLAIVDRVGRRRLTLRMVPGTAAALFLLGGLFVFGLDGPDTTWLIIAFLIVFMIFNAGGLQLMGWLTGSEIYPLGVRANGTSVQAASLWGTNLLITLTTLSIIEGIGVGPAMWIYAAFNVAGWIFVFKFMPELTGRSLEQIEGALEEGKFRPADFERAAAARAGAGAATA